MNQVLLYSVGADCVDLSSGNVRQDLGFNQCEADTIMLSFYVALWASGYNDPVVIDATDTDVCIQAPAVSHDVPGVICIKKKDELLFCKGMCTNEDIAKCLIQFQVMTGCDANSCFYGHGKTTLHVYDKMAKSTKAQKILSKCGKNLPLHTDVLNDLISYVIQFVYGDVHSSNLDSAEQLSGKAKRRNPLCASHLTLIV